MNKAAALFVLFLIPVFVKAQTAGQVMFVGFNADGNDGFSFVTLVDLANGTNIHFNDNEWNGTIFNTGADGGVADGSLTWTNNTGAAIAAGTVITINNSATTPSASVGTTSGGTIDLRDQDEVLYMFTGTTASLPATFLCAIANDAYGAGNGALPGTLTVGTNAISITGDEDVMIFNGSTNCNTTIAACAAVISTTANWSTQDNAATDDSNNGFPDFPTDVACDFFGTAMYPMITYYSVASGAWDANTSWSLSADGSTGVVAAGVWPRRSDNVIIRSGHAITIDDVADNKSCGISPDGLPKTNVGPVASIPMFYQTGDILVNGTLTVSGIEIMVEGYTHLTSVSITNLGSSLVNLGYLEVDASAVMNGLDDLILTGNSTTIINTNSTLADDLIIDFTNATLCGTGTTALTTNGGSRITYLHSATVAQICTLFQVTCPNGGCTGAPATGTGTMLLGNSGPGGVGNDTNNELWLRADNLTLANLASVSSWSDVSGNSLNATNATAAQQPTFNTNVANGFPALNFDGGDYLSLGTPPSLNLIPGTNSWSFFCVYNVNTGNSGTFFSKATGTAGTRQYQYTFDTNTLTSFIGGSYVLGSVNSSNAWTVGAHRNNTTNRDSWTNENANVSGQAIGTGTVTTTDVLIGARRDVSATDFGFALTGRISEIAVYNVSVTAVQRIIVTNYLSAKYNTTLAANDVYTMDDAGNGNFDYEAAGIGQASDGTSHRDGRGSGIVRMWNPGNLGNSEFLIWGHDGTALYSSTASGVDGIIIQERLSRTWRLSETGDVGTVSISFDISSLGTPLGSNLRLLIDRNGNGFADNDVTPVAGSFTDNIVVFSGINFQNGDRFTLGNTDITNPLPVELIGFSARAEKSIVRLKWTTASETNNDFFTVERSKNAQQWEVVRNIPGAGTSIIRNNYETIDDGPYSGASYYRLKQTDYNSNVANLDIVRVVRDLETPVSLYPNPFQDDFKLLAEFEIDPAQTRLYNSKGLEIPVTMTKKDEEVIVSPGNIPSGLYILKVMDGFLVRTIKIIKN